MRLKITLLSKNPPLSLPIHYNHIVQAFIYENISSELAQFLHEKGYAYEKRHFKLFVFSNLYGKYTITDKHISFHDKVVFWLCSPLDDVLSQFANSLFKKELQLIGQTVLVEAVEIQRENITDNPLQIQMLSPVTVYSTEEVNGKKKTHYFAPTDPQFSDQIIKNLQKKYLSLYPDADPAKISGKINIDPKTRYQEKIIRYKDFIIKGWMGKFHLEGTPEFLRFALATGIGAKNSQGLGCCEMVDKKYG